MASQFASIAPIPFPAPKATNVRVVYSAGRTAAAVDAKLADMPKHKRDATLEELAVIGLTDQAIAEARGLLSTHMFAAFLDWAEAAVLAETVFEDDGGDVPESRSDQLNAACAAIALIDPSTVHETGLKAYINMMEYGDCPSFGPVTRAAGNSPAVRMVGDFITLSPLLNSLSELAATAWSFSPTSAFAENIGHVIAGRIAKARSTPAIAVVPTQSSSALNLSLEPSAEWCALAAAYYKARAEEEAYEREFCAFDRTLPVGPERAAALDAIPKEHWDGVQRFADVRADAEDALLKMPSPTAQAFALKVLICNEEGRDLNDPVLEAEAKQFVAGDPALVWAQRMGDWQAKRAAYETHYRDVLLPADARSRAVTDKWPLLYDFSADPAADAERRAVDYSDIDDHNQDLCGAATDAMIALLLTPVPDLVAFATKIEILKKEEGSTLTRIDEIVDQLAVDSRALCGVDADGSFLPAGL